MLDDQSIIVDTFCFEKCADDGFWTDEHEGVITRQIRKSFDAAAQDSVRSIIPTHDINSYSDRHGSPLVLRINLGVDADTKFANLDAKTWTDIARLSASTVVQLRHTREWADRWFDAGDRVVGAATLASSSALSLCWKHVALLESGDRSSRQSSTNTPAAHAGGGREQ